MERDGLQDRTEQGNRSKDTATPLVTVKSVSVIIPNYNEEKSLALLAEELKQALASLQVGFELIFVDDGSRDDTVLTMRNLCQEEPCIKYVRLQRNFGKAAALDVGFRRAKGDVVVTMDGDLQDRPDQIAPLLIAIDGGADLVSGWKWPRKDPLSKRLASKIFNFALRVTTGVRLHDINCGLKAYRKTLLDDMRLYGDMHRFIPVLAHVKGYHLKEVKVAHRPRKFGKSRYALGRYYRVFLDFITVMFLTRYRPRPLHFLGGIGVFFGFSGVLLSIFAYIASTSGGVDPIFYVGLLFCLIAVQLISTGLMAELATSYFRERWNEYPIKEEIGFNVNYDE
jgi:glycosyltransferase involved in cell wall biosynthesis